jgi:hypothetical protein
MVCWVGQSFFTSEYTAFVAYYDAWSCDLCVSASWGFGQPGAVATSCEAASRYHGTAEPDASCAYTAALIDATTLEGDVRADFHSMDTGEGDDLGGGCGDGGTIPLPICVSPGFDLSLVDAAPFDLAFPILSFDTLGVSCGPCTLVANPFGGFVGPPHSTGADGSAAFELPLSPFVPSGLTFYAQWVVVGGAASCASLAADLSNAVRLVTEDI